MNSHLAVVLTNGSLDDGNGNQSQTRSGAVLQILKDSVDIALSCPQGNIQSSTLKQTSSSIGVQSDDDKATELGGTSLRGLQDVGKPSRLNLPITVRTGRPVLCNQPIRIKVVIPGLCKRPITNSATSSTKAVVPSDGPVCPLGPVAESSGPGPDQRMEIDPNEISAERNQTTTFTTTTENQTEDAERAGRGHGARNSAEDGGDGATPLPSTPDSVHTQRDRGTREEMEEEEEEEEEEEGDSKNQVSLQHSLSLAIAERSGMVKAVETRAVEEEEEERGEQLEVLDLSLPKKIDGGVKAWRSGCFLGDAGCESSLIMEVDEIEGEGDRDVVEEDDGEDEEDTEPREGLDEDGNPLPSPSFFSTSILTSLSSIDRDSESFLLIDDKGIPYTLTADGNKVPQIDSSPLSGQAMGRSDAVGVGEKRLAAASGVQHTSLSSANTQNTHTEHSGILCGSAETGSSKTTELSEGLEVLKSLGLLKTTEPEKVLEGAVKVAVSKPCGAAVPPQSIQILTNPSSNTPFLLVSSTPRFSSSPLALSLPLSLPQNSPGTSTPMLLLLSSIPSSSGQSFSTSTPIAVINSSTGQLSQITASPPSISLPLTSAQVTPAGSAPSCSSSSHPVIRLTPNNPPLILSRAGENSSLPSTLPSPSVLSSSTKLPTVVFSGNSGVQMLCSAPQVKSGLSDPDPDDSPSAEETQLPPSPPAPPQTSQPTSELSGQPSPGESDQSPGPESELASLTSDSFPLNDHPYFSSGSTAACGSPTLVPIVPAGQPGELEPLSPPSSPSSLGPRRVLFCQLCPRVFYYLSDLERHSITHSQIKPHVCQQCGKAFKRSSHLQRHKHIHTGQRNFVCSICAKRFRESGELQRHQRVHTGEKPYQCQLCHTRFAERNTLRRHTRRKHPYHQVAMEMLSERRGGGGGVGGGAGGGGGGDEEESAEWYSSTVSNFGNSDSETDT